MIGLHSRHRVGQTRSALIFAATLITTCLVCDVARSQQRFEHVFQAMGVQFRFVAYTESQANADAAFEVAVKRVTELDAIFSDYKNDSESRRLVDHEVGQPVEVSRDLWYLLELSQRIHKESDGAFDITIGPVTRLWRLARKRQRLPSDDELRDAVRLVGGDRLTLVKPSQVVVSCPNMRLDFGAIAKGYAADECLSIFRNRGIASAFVDASGNVAFGEPPPGEPGWVVGIASYSGSPDNARRLCLSNCGIATSSDRSQALELDGTRYSHIVDPRTGRAITQRSSVTVVATNATDADAWGTAFSVLGPQRSIELAEQRGDLQALIVVEAAQDQPLSAYQTSHFKDLLK